MAKVSALIESLVEDKNYNNCRLVVMNEQHEMIACEMLQHVLFQTYKTLKKLVMLNWKISTKEIINYL